MWLDPEKPEEVEDDPEEVEDDPEEEPEEVEIKICGGLECIRGGIPHLRDGGMLKTLGGCGCGDMVRRF